MFTNQQLLSTLQDYRSVVVELINAKMQLEPHQILMAQRVQMRDEIKILKELHLNLTESIDQLKNGKETL